MRQPSGTAHKKNDDHDDAQQEQAEFDGMLQERCAVPASPNLQASVE